MRLLVVLLPIVVAAVIIIVFLLVRRPAAPRTPAADYRRRATNAAASFHLVVDRARPGPLRDRLQGLGGSVDAATAEALRVADIVEAADPHREGAPFRRLDQIVTTLEGAVTTAAELAAAGGDETGRLSAGVDALHAAFRELDPGA